MTTRNTGSTLPPRRPSSLRRRAVLVPLVVAVCFSAGSALAVWMIRDDLPARIAVHWGADGRADGFTEGWASATGHSPGSPPAPRDERPW